MRKILLLITIIILSSCQNTIEDGVDYTVSKAEFPTDFQAGDTTSVSFTVKNQGNEDDTNPFTVKLYVYSHYVFDADNAIYLNEQNNIAALKKNGEWNGTLSFTVPADIPAETYFFLKIESNAAETNLANNIVSSSRIDVTGGSVSRTEVAVDNVFHELSINSSDTDYYFFQAIAGHAYQIYWDDYYEGTTYFNTGADIRVTATSADGLTVFHTDVDNGYYTPITVAIGSNENINLNIKSSSWYGKFGIKIRDVGLPADLTVTIDNHLYNVSTKVIEVTYTVHNNSAVALNGDCFYIGFWLDRTTTPQATDLADHYVNKCPTISPSSQITYTEFITTSIKSGAAYAYVDVYNNVTEGNETNNVTVAYNW